MSNINPGIQFIDMKALGKYDTATNDYIDNIEIVNKFNTDKPIYISNLTIENESASITLYNVCGFLSRVENEYSGYSFNAHEWVLTVYDESNSASYIVVRIELDDSGLAIYSDKITTA